MESNRESKKQRSLEVGKSKRPASSLQSMGESESETEAELGEGELQFGYMVCGYPGIIAAGCCYPFFISVFVASYLCVTSLGVDLSRIEDALAGIMFFSIFGGFFGLCISVVTGLISIVLVCTMNWSLGFPVKPRFASVSAGSLAGYMPTAWVLFTPSFGKELEETAALGFLGPLLAMTLGAYGASLASRSYSRRSRMMLDRGQKRTLSISHMMIATAWIAVIFATANYFGGLEFAIAAAAWFLLQGVMYSAIRIWKRFRNPQKSLSTSN